MKINRWPKREGGKTRMNENTNDAFICTLLSFRFYYFRASRRPSIFVEVSIHTERTEEAYCVRYTAYYRYWPFCGHEKCINFVGTYVCHISSDDIASMTMTHWSHRTEQIEFNAIELKFISIQTTNLMRQNYNILWLYASLNCIHNGAAVVFFRLLCDPIWF